MTRRAVELEVGAAAAATARVFEAEISGERSRAPRPPRAPPLGRGGPGGDARRRPRPRWRRWARASRRTGLALVERLGRGPRPQDHPRRPPGLTAGRRPRPATLCEVTDTTTASDHPLRQSRRQDRRAACRAGGQRAGPARRRPRRWMLRLPVRARLRPGQGRRPRLHRRRCLRRRRQGLDAVRLRLRGRLRRRPPGRRVPGQQPERRRCLRLWLVFPGERRR